MESCKCEGVIYFINGVLYAPKYKIDGEYELPVEYVPYEFDAFEYSPNYDRWISDFFI